MLKVRDWNFEHQKHEALVEHLQVSVELHQKMVCFDGQGLLLI